MLADHVIPFPIQAGIQIAEILHELVDIDGPALPFRSD